VGGPVILFEDQDNLYLLNITNAMFDTESNSPITSVSISGGLWDVYILVMQPVHICLKLLNNKKS
jgi:hypothetical protein